MFIQKLIMNNFVFASSLHTGSSSISIKDVSPSLHLPKTSYVTQIYIQQSHNKIAQLSYHIFFHKPFHSNSFGHFCSVVTLFQICLCYHPGPNTPIFSPSLSVCLIKFVLSASEFSLIEMRRVLKVHFSEREHNTLIQIHDEQDSVLFIKMNTNKR